MDFRRNADRRRRVLREDLSSSKATQVETKVQRVGRYDGRRTLQRQPKLIDLIPTSSWTVWPICLTALILSCGLILLNAQLPASASSNDASSQQNEAASSFSSVTANTELFQLSAPGSVAQSFLTIFTITSALICFQIYFVRRHRQDDYLGQYQIWRWLAAFFFCLVVGNLPWFKPLVSGIFQSLTPEVYHSFTTKILLGSGLFLLLGVGVRTFLEVKESVCSTFCIMTGTVLSSLSILLLPELETGIHQIPAIGNLPSETAFGLWFLGSAFYFCSFSIYLSYVHKDVQGKLESARQARRLRKEQQEAVAEEKKPAASSTSSKSTTKATSSKKTDSEVAKKNTATKTVNKSSSTKQGTTTTNSFQDLAAQLEPEPDSETNRTKANGKSRRRKKAA